MFFRKSAQCHILLLLVFMVHFQPSLQAQTEGEAAKQPPAEPAPIVWFVHGMITIRDNFNEEIRVLKEIYPQAEEVKLISWKAPKIPLYKIKAAWAASLKNAEAFVPEFVKQMKELPEEKRERLILVGHSLGARIVVRASVECARMGIHVRQIILAGAAINNDDPDIEKTTEVSRQPVLNIINFNDVLLAAYKVGGEFHTALGTGYLYPMDSKKFRELVMTGTVNHYGYEYFRCLQKALKTGNFDYAGIIVPQDSVQVDFSTMGGQIVWDDLDKCQGWRLQQHQATGHARILDPKDVRRAWGRTEIMTIAFQKVKKQLNEQKNKKGSE